MTLGELIKKLRKANGNMSQKKLVDMVKRRRGDLSQPQLSAIENDEVDNPSALPHIAGVFGMTYDELIAAARGKKAPPPPAERAHKNIEANNVVAINELDVHVAAGNGFSDDAGGLMARHEDAAVTGVHTYPAASFREAYGINPGRVRIIPVRGTSMEPELWSGQRVMVDIEDVTPSPPGIFVIWDGLGLVLKYVEVVANSDPVRVRISSAHQAFKPYERNIEEAYINGRVIGVWKRM